MQPINFLIFKFEAKSYIKFKITDGLKSKIYKIFIIHIDISDNL